MGHNWIPETSQAGSLDTIPQFSSLLINRGEVGFHKLLARSPQRLIINEIGPVEIVDDATTEFRAPIRWAVSIRDGASNLAIPENSLVLSGRLFDLEGAEDSLLSSAVLSHELHDTGSAVLPYVFTDALISEHRS
jgi:hypothetical protein